MKSSVDNDRQFELDALGCSQPVKAGKSICNMLRVTATENTVTSLLSRSLYNEVTDATEMQR